MSDTICICIFCGSEKRTRGKIVFDSGETWEVERCDGCDRLFRELAPTKDVVA